MTLRDQLLKVIEIYASANNCAEASISTQLFSGGKRVRQIRDGGDLGTMAFERAMRWLSDHWPDGVDWPTEVVRPDLVLEAAE